jgi:uncharacterized protein YyaL (SSP411 family)
VTTDSTDDKDQPPRHTNRLGNETSPYLLQHAANPVDWYPWGEQALAESRLQDKPILLSVGYSACHWCHVMERESFENDDIAQLMNKHYISVKVDREERPDLDEIYMAAVQAMTGSGGWPMTVFLTPDLRPFYGGTYFPPDDRYGRPGFPRVLESVARHYQEQREQVEVQAQRLTDFLVQNSDPLTVGGDLQDSLLTSAPSQLASNYDSQFGGFGEGPKFPNSDTLALLLRIWHDTGDEESLQIVTHTLVCMSRGGIYDHLGGGFHRYSVDKKWLVPHFEKMLYDNALLVPVLLDAHLATGDRDFRRTALHTLDYVLREMSHPDGGYYSTQDADSEGVEGKFFVWTPEEIEDVLDDEDAVAVLCQFFGVTPQGNFEHGKSILHIEKDLEVFARQASLGVDDLRSTLDRGIEALREARQRRVAPSRDDKIVVAWNGLMASAMIRGYQISGDQRYLDSARQSMRRLLDDFVVDGQLRHGGLGASIGWQPAFQDDLAAIVGACVDLYEATFELNWLASAQHLASEMIDVFWDAEGHGFYYVRDGCGDVLVRSKNPFDGATPSGNALAAEALLRLAALTGDPQLRQCAQQTLALYATAMKESPNACPRMMSALHRYLRGDVEITVVGDASQRGEYLRTIHAHFIPRRVLAGADPGASLSTSMPMLEGRLAQPAVFVCQDQVCSAPLSSAAEVDTSLRQITRTVAT